MPIGNAHESFTQQGGIGRPVTRGHEPQRNVPALQRVERLAVDQHRAGTRVELSALRELAVHAVMKLAGFFRPVSNDEYRALAVQAERSFEIIAIEERNVVF